jgi:hypothetical protein
MVLQNSQNAGRLIFGQTTKHSAIADRCSLNRATEVACEFVAECGGPPYQFSIAAPTAIWLLRMGQPKGADGLSSMVDANDMRERGVPMTHTAQHLGRMHYWLSGSVRWQASRTVMLACKKAR